MKYARGVLGGMALAVQGLARVASRVHDGVVMHGVPACADVLKVVRDSVPAPVSNNKHMTQGEVLAELESSWPHDARTATEELAEYQCALVSDAMQGCVKGHSPQLYARNVALALDCAGHPIKQVCKHIGNWQYMHWDGTWSQGDARDKLRPVFGEVMAKRLRSWHGDTRSVTHVAVYASSAEVCSQMCTVEAVARFIRPRLRDSDFKTWTTKGNIWKLRMLSMTT